MKSIVTIGMLALSLNTFAEATFDKTEVLNDVTLKSTKNESVRSYFGSTEKTLPFPIDIVKKSVTNFEARCNNSYKSKREFTDTEADCRFHNENLIESFVVKEIPLNETHKAFSEVYLVGRKIYNRGTFGYYEIVTVKNELVDAKKVTTVDIRMLSNEEVKAFISPKIERESVFDSSMARFVLKEISPTETSVSYEYSSETDHWLLNKEVSVPQVFVSISKSVNDLMTSLESDSSSQKRELASKQ